MEVGNTVRPLKANIESIGGEGDEGRDSQGRSADTIPGSMKCLHSHSRVRMSNGGTVPGAAARCYPFSRELAIAGQEWPRRTLNGGEKVLEGQCMMERRGHSDWNYQLQSPERQGDIYRIEPAPRIGFDDRCWKMPNLWYAIGRTRHSTPRPNLQWRSGQCAYAGQESSIQDRACGSVKPSAERCGLLRNLNRPRLPSSPSSSSTER